MNVPQYNKGKIMTDEQGKPIRLEVGKEIARKPDSLRKDSPRSLGRT